MVLTMATDFPLIRKAEYFKSYILTKLLKYRITHNFILMLATSDENTNQNIPYVQNQEKRKYLFTCGHLSN